MKGLVVIGAAVLVMAAAADLRAANVAAVAKVVAAEQGLLLEGPVESINAKLGVAVVLGQKLSIILPAGVTVGDAVSLYGTLTGSGALAISKVTNQGIYVPGASHVVLTGLVQQVQASIGRAKIGGLNVDLTSISPANGSVPVVGSIVQISGTQPSSHGLVLAAGIVSGTKLNGIVGGGAANGIVGGGAANGIVGGGAANGVGGGAANGIVGGGAANGIVGGGAANGIVGGGAANGIVGGGAANGIVGGGAANGIVGGGAANGIVGGGAANGIVGGGFH